MKISFNDIIRKLTARKLWLALLLFAAGGFFTSGGDVTELDKILDAACKISGVLSFVFSEAAIDSARAAAGTALPEIKNELEDVLE